MSSASEVLGSGETEESDAYIRIRGLQKTFSGGSVIAVDDFDLDIDEDEFVVFLGPSGCGKTTTLRCISGLEVPDEGEVIIDGNEVTFDKPKDRDLAFVFQNITLFPHMSVRENMRFGLDMKTDMPKDEKNQRVEETAELLGIEEMLDREPAALSGGQQQRVSIGRAMVMEPTAFLLDEPFANLDANLRDRMQTEIKRLQRRLETSMIFVTHDQEEAMTLGDKIVIMNDAEIQQVGTPYQIYNEPANEFVARFIGSPSTNMFEATVRRDDNGVWLVTDSSEFALPEERAADLSASDGQSVTFGIRPEYMNVVEAGNGIFDAEIDVKELHGEHDAIYFSIGKTPFTVTEPQGAVRDIEPTKGVDFDASQVWVFNQGGKRVL
jgi:multiple sugar transport system ATP-binding protein